VGISEYDQANLKILTDRLGHPSMAFLLISMFRFIHAEQLPPPQSLSELVRSLSLLLRNPRIQRGEHMFQVRNLNRKYDLYAFDSTYAERYPHRSAFLVSNDRLWPDSGESGSLTIKGLGVDRIALAGEGTTTILIPQPIGSWSNTDARKIPPREIRGVRVADFPRYLFALARQMADSPHEAHYHGVMKQLATGLTNFVLTTTGDERAFLNLLASNPNHTTAWAAYSDWLEDHGQPPAGRYLLSKAQLVPESLVVADIFDLEVREYLLDRDQSLIQNHVAQLNYQREPPLSWRRETQEVHLETERSLSTEYAQIMLFDDHWAFEHSNLARSATRFASRWDAL
jgi:uncharacterized protein (TIGR02996 family)